jgi:hypothetical protein
MGFDMVTLNYAATLNLKIMAVIQSNVQHCQGWSQSKAAKQLRIDFFLITYSQPIHEVIVVMFSINFEGHKSKMQY